MINLTSIPQFARNVNRLREVVTVLGRYGLAGWIGRVDIEFVKGLFKGRDGAGLTDLGRDTRIRLALSELGPTFIKLGQMLSTRPDLVGNALARELSALQDNAPADRPEAVRSVVEAELGQRIDEVFVEFEDQPLASASIAQVHRARLQDGKLVVVKIQHPDLEPRLRVDLDILVGLADLAEKYLPELAPYRPRATAAEFQRMLLRELDFGREERNLQQFASNFAGNLAVRFPTPCSELTTSRVLTMEYLEGTRLTELSQLRTAGADGEEVARRGAEVFLEMIFRDGFYHADPHPGNLLLLPGGVLGVLDCGMVGRLDERMREEIEDMLLAIVTGDAAHLTSLVTRLGSVPPETDQHALSADLSEFLSYHTGVALNQIHLGKVLGELTEIIRRHHIVLPTNIALLLRMLVLLEGTARLLKPGFSLVELMQPYQKKLLWRRLSPARHLHRLRRLYHEWEYMAEVLPRGVVDVLQQVQRGRFTVHLEHERLQPAVNRLVFGLLTSALYVGSALLWSHHIPPLLGGVSVVGALGCLISGVLGLRLLWAINRSGHLDR